jgi:ribosomal protein S11
MFLLQILQKKNLHNKNNLGQILKYNNYIKNLKKKISLLQDLKRKKNYKKLSIFFKNKKTFPVIKQDLILYKMNITLSKKNTIVYVTDVKGNLKLFQSTSSLNITGKQKTSQPAALFKVLKIILSKGDFLQNKPIALHCNNVKKRYIVFLLTILENILFIKVIRIYNFLIPHNGCRPKKLKRKKRRKLEFN